MPTPVDLIELAKKILRPAGVLCVKVPNDFSELQLAAQSQLNNEPWWIASPDHINYFNFQSLGALLERRTYKEPFTVAESLAILLQMANDGKLEMVLVHALGRTLEKNVNSIQQTPDESLIALAPLYQSPVEAR